MIVNCGINFNCWMERSWTPLEPTVSVEGEVYIIVLHQVERRVNLHWSVEDCTSRRNDATCQKTECTKHQVELKPRQWHDLYYESVCFVFQCMAKGHSPPYHWEAGPENHLAHKSQCAASVCRVPPSGELWDWRTLWTSFWPCNCECLLNTYY